MNVLDWIVIAVYGMGMLAIGFYFSTKSKTSEDYMLGGRHLKSWMVGLSIFATLISAISYTMFPGEMILYGPIILLGFLSYPLIYLVVGWLLLPLIMKQKISSAYELLEIKLGPKVRVLAAIFFLSMRLIWMSVVIYISSEKIIAPIMGWEPGTAIWVGIVMAVVTIIYTSMGGLRAVIVTDTIQTFILFAGALMAIIIITHKMGFAWWPAGWPEHWEHLRFVSSTGQGAGRTLLGALLSAFTWYICTAGSDQMAIQRYLSTKDVQAARKAQKIALISHFSVVVLLSILGMALLGFFTANANLLRQGWTIAENSDELLPLFIAERLPIGFSGLVMAGLLAAAMSSLSSGINSSALVITNDFIGRFGKKELSMIGKVRLAQFISVVIGVVIILMCVTVRYVRGNLMEVSYKTVNLLVAPLFVPFFMAYFVRRATDNGTFVGMIVSVVVAILIGYWPEFTGHEGLGFLWIMPLSLVVGVMVSYLASLVTTRQKMRSNMELKEH